MNETKQHVFVAAILTLVMIAYPAPTRAQACFSGGAFSCTSCGAPHMTGLAGAPPASARYSWWDFDNRTGNRGAIGFSDFTQCSTQTGDICPAPIGASDWVVGVGLWSNALNCGASGSVPNTSILFEDNSSGGIFAYINAQDNQASNADMDAAPNQPAAASVMTATPRPAVPLGGIVQNTATGAGCAVGPCMDVTFTISDLPAPAIAKNGGPILTTANRGWVLYIRPASAGAPTEGVRDANWAVATRTGGGAASQNIAAGATMTIKCPQVDTFFCLAPVFGGTGVTGRAAGEASTTPDAAFAAQETIYLGPSLRVNPASSAAISAKAVYAKPTQVTISWTTFLESSVAGFNVHRSTDQRLWTKVNAGGLIPAQGQGGSGASYKVTDTINQQGYSQQFYKIDMVGTTGQVQATVIVKAQIPLN